MSTINFVNINYVVEPGVNTVDGAVDPATLSGAEQISLYNLIASNLGQPPVRKFADRKAGAKRIVAKLIEYDKEMNEEHAADPDPETETPAEDKPKPATKPKKTPAKDKRKVERKKRGMRFVFPFNGPDHQRAVQNDESLRGQCVTMLKKGAKFADVEQLVVDFDKEHKRKPKHVERRAYELVRIMHYYLGWGVGHDPKTGVIKLHTREPGQ